jgi:hypothetical protein
LSIKLTPGREAKKWGKNALFRIGFFVRLVFFSSVILRLNEVKAKNLGEGLVSIICFLIFVRLVLARR